LEDEEPLVVPELAEAIHEKASEDVAKAFRVHCARRGADLEEGLMIAFGGSGPIQACSVAEKIGIRKICFPNGAGVFSAIGLVFAPRSYEYSRTQLLEVDPAKPDQLSATWAALLAACRQLFGFGPNDSSAQRPLTTLAMRYRGQGYELPIEIGDPDELVPDRVRARFEDRYRSLNGFAFEDTPVEIVHWRLELVQDDERNFSAYGFEREPIVVPDSGEIFVKGATAQPAPRLQRTSLIETGPRAGPLLIVDDGATILIASGFTAEADSLGNVYAARQRDNIGQQGA